MTPRRVLTLSGLAASLLFGPALAQETKLEAHRWPKVKGTTYYQGTIVEPSRRNGKVAKTTRQFRTTETQIFLPEGAVTSVKAYVRRNPSTAAKLLQTIAAGQIKVQSVIVNPRPPSPPPPETAEEPTEPSTPVEYQTPGESKAVHRSALVNTLRGTLFLGLGAESLAAKGGASKFEGSSGVSSLGVRTLWNASNSGNPDWLNGFQVNVHQFNPKIEETTNSDGLTSDAAETKIKQMRVFAAVSGFYDGTDWLTRSALTHFHFGVGLGLLRMPALQVSDTDTSAAQPTAITGVGPFCALLGHRQLTENQFLLGGVSLVPHLFGQMTTGSTFEAYGAYQYHFIPLLYSELAMMMRRDSVRLKAGCPEGSECTSTSTAVSSLSQIQIGLGFNL